MIGEKYHVTGEIGAGGMGAVYDAIHSKTGRRVAIKLIRENVLGKSGEATRRFEREARAAGAIDSQHVAQVLDSGEDPASGLPYIVIEFLQGEDLRSLLARHGRLDPPVALAIVAQALLGIRKAHESDIVHRDLKPANIFVAKADDDQRIVKVLDFGIAKFVESGRSASIDSVDEPRLVSAEQPTTVESTQLTRHGDVIGSPPYMSPEQLRSSAHVDGRTDVWSMGVVLYECLAGVTPTHHLALTHAKVAAIMTEDARPIGDLAPWVSPEVQAIVARALQRDPSRRFASAQEMLAAVRSLLPSGITLTESMLSAGASQAELADDATTQKVVEGGVLPNDEALAPTLPSNGNRLLSVGVDAHEDHTASRSARRWTLLAAAAAIVAVVSGSAIFIATRSSPVRGTVERVAADSAITEHPSSMPSMPAMQAAPSSSPPAIASETPPHPSTARGPTRRSEPAVRQSGIPGARPLAQPGASAGRDHM